MQIIALNERSHPPARQQTAAFPDGAASPGPAAVLMVCAEDSEAAILKRLDKVPFPSVSPLLRP